MPCAAYSRPRVIAVAGKGAGPAGYPVEAPVSLAPRECSAMSAVLRSAVIDIVGLLKPD